jgi:hypothetical protein
MVDDSFVLVEDVVDGEDEDEDVEVAVAPTLAAQTPVPRTPDPATASTTPRSWSLEATWVSLPWAPPFPHRQPPSTLGPSRLDAPRLFIGPMTSTMAPTVTLTHRRLSCHVLWPLRVRAFPLPAYPRPMGLASESRVAGVLDVVSCRSASTAVVSWALLSSRRLLPPGLSSSQSWCEPGIGSRSMVLWQPHSDVGMVGRWNRRPQLVHGLPLRRVDNRPLPQRVPTHQRLGPRVFRHHCVSQPNVQGWMDILQRSQPVLQRSSNPREVALAPRKSSAAMACFRGSCFRCLARDHMVASCRDPLKCFHCRGSGHISKHCAAHCSLDNR